MPLTDVKARALKPKEKDYKASDEKGLFLLVKKNGSKYFRYDYRFQGKRKTLAIGVYPKITMKQAREKRDDARKKIAQGVDPSSTKKHIQNKKVLLSYKGELQNFIDTANQPIFGIDTEGKVNKWNQQAEAITGYSKSEVMGQHLVDNFITEDYKEPVQKVLDEALKGSQTDNYELPLYTKGGNRVDVLLNSTTRRDAQGRIVGVVGVGQNITALNRARKDFEVKLAAAADEDVLTGLPNRRYLNYYLEKELRTHQGGNDNRGAFLFLDLDSFKLVNDSLGHQVGDDLLKIVAQRLKRCVRENDLVCRLGGDEFVILVPLAVRTIEQTNALVRKIIRNIDKSITKPIQIGSHKLNTHASIGICDFISEDKVEDIINRADNAMYLAKKDPRNFYSFYTVAVHQMFEHKMRVLKGITRGLTSNQFYMEYQPQFNHIKELVGVEALIRWQHPQLGQLDPNQFILLAEQNHRINEIGTWIIETVFKQVKQWSQGGLIIPKIAINISPLQLLESNFPENIRLLAEKYDTDPKKIVFEITESADVEQFSLIRKILMELKNKGYRFSLDDFGTGFASMAQFKRLPFSQVKIDQSFIADIETSPYSLAITEVVLTIAKTLKLDVIAEGVETQAQLDILTKLGCTGYQGYLFSRPVEADLLQTVLSDL